MEAEEKSESSLTRALAVFPRKLKWRVKKNFVTVGIRDGDNYESGGERKQIFEEEVKSQEKRGCR